jgi:lipid-binding SYLF domain-containing protein
MRTLHAAAALLVAVIFALSSAQAGPEEKRAEVRASAASVLAQLYEAQPSAQRAVEGAAGGHAVFSNFGLKIFVAGGGTGKGLAVNHRTGHETFMKMVEVQAGLGFGAKKFGVVFVFETEDALKTFVESGWEFGGQAAAAAKYGEKGAALEGAISVSPGVWMYQITDKGLAAELVVKGTKYLKDGDLN